LVAKFVDAFGGQAVSKITPDPGWSPRVSGGDDVEDDEDGYL
jgi:hypothetical protein